jgi:hypothetical protein
VEVVVEN